MFLNQTKHHGDTESSFPISQIKKLRTFAFLCSILFIFAKTLIKEILWQDLKEFF